MQLTTPQTRAHFRGDRLREARLARGFKKVDLAKEVGVTPAAVGQYERGDIVPGQSAFSRLVRVLRFPPEFFFSGPRVLDLSEDRIHFRRLRATSSRLRGEQVARLALLEEVVERLEERVLFPTIALTQLPPGRGDRFEIEATAAKVRADWGIGDGPIANIVMLIESRGAVITRFAGDAAGIDAYSRWSGGRPIIVLTNDKDDAARSNFDAAHELGHLVMHPDAEPGSVVIEHQAQAFAAAFLMPASTVRDELPRRFDLRAYVELKRRWRVSIQALLYRARTLEILSEPAFRRAMSRISLWGWRTGEPHGLGAADEPTLIRSALELVARDRGLADSHPLEELHIPADVLQSMMPAARPTHVLLQ